MDIQLPDNLLFVDIEPVEQQGFRVVNSTRGVRFDAWFEGRLSTRVRFRLRTGQ